MTPTQRDVVRRLLMLTAIGICLHDHAADAAESHQEVHVENEAEHCTTLIRRPKQQGPVGVSRSLLQASQQGSAEQTEMRRQRWPFNRVASLNQESDGSQSRTKRGIDQSNLTTTLEDMTSEYIGLIGVGTGPNGDALFHARVVFDTGSTNLWVASVLCNASPCTPEKSRSFYDPAKSLTQESFSALEDATTRSNNNLDASKDIDIIFGTGELRGPLHVDTYRVGPMVVQHQPFAMIRSMQGDVFSSFPFEGILGLGFPSLSFGNITPFFEHVIEQRLLKSNEFSFFLNANPEQPSAILWGGVDKSLYEGPIRMFPVVQPHYWALELLGFRIGNQSFGDGKLRRLIVDTGTTYFTAPDFMHQDVVDRIPATSCSEVERRPDKYPPLVWTIRNSHGSTYDLEVPQQTYMLGDGDESANVRNDEGHCKPAFMLLDVNEKYGPAMILGEVFMRSFLTVFCRGNGDVKQAKIGFAKARVGAVPKSNGEPSLLQPADQAAQADEGVQQRQQEAASPKQHHTSHNEADDREEDDEGEEDRDEEDTWMPESFSEAPELLPTARNRPRRRRIFRLPQSNVMRREHGGQLLPDDVSSAN